MLVLSLRLCEMLHRKILSSPPLVKLVLNLATSLVLGDGFNCRRLDAALLAALTVEWPLPMFSAGAGTTLMISLALAETSSSSRSSWSASNTSSEIFSSDPALVSNFSIFSSVCILSSLSLSSSRRDSSISSSLLRIGSELLLEHLSSCNRVLTEAMSVRAGVEATAAVAAAVATTVLAAPVLCSPSPIPAPIIIFIDS